MDTLPETGFLRLAQIIGHRAASTSHFNHRNGDRYAAPDSNRLIPVSRSTWWNGVREGYFPKPFKMGRTTVWRVEDIRALIAKIGGTEGGGA